MQRPKIQRREVLATTLAAGLAGAAGCLGSLTANDEDGTGDEGNGSGTTSNDDNPNGETRTITVSDSGEVTADPDLAVVQAGVEITGDDAESVRDDLDERGDALYDALIESGLDEDDVTTDRYDISREIDYRRLEEEGADPQSEDDLEEYTDYHGEHRFRIEVHDVDAVGSVVDTAIDAGADDVGRGQFTLSEDKRSAFREDALEEAMAAASREAEFLAGEVDATIVEAKHVDTSGGDVSPTYADVAVEEDADDAADTELHPDDVSVSATVEVVYVID